MVSVFVVFVMYYLEPVLHKTCNTCVFEVNVVMINVCKMYEQMCVIENTIMTRGKMSIDYILGKEQKSISKQTSTAVQTNKCSLRFSLMIESSQTNYCVEMLPERNACGCF